MKLLFPIHRKKIKSVKQICQDMYQNPETAVLVSKGVSKGIRSPDINNFGHCTSKTLLLFSNLKCY